MTAFLQGGDSLASAAIFWDADNNPYTPTSGDTIDMGLSNLTIDAGSESLGWINGATVTFINGTLHFGAGMNVAFGTSFILDTACNFLLDGACAFLGFITVTGNASQFGFNGQTLDMTGGELAFYSLPTNVGTSGGGISQVGVLNYGVGTLYLQISSPGPVTEAQIGSGAAILAQVNPAILVSGTNGAQVLAANSDVRLGVANGGAGTGTCAVPTASQVLSGVAVDATIGNVVLPAANHVLAGDTFGPNSATTGTLANDNTDIATILTDISTLLTRIPGTVQPQTGDTYSRLGAPAGASVSADIASAKSSVGSVTGSVGSVTAGITVTTNNDKTGYSGTATNFVAAPTVAAIDTQLTGSHGSGAWGGSFTILPLASSLTSPLLGQSPPLVAYQHRAFSFQIAIYDSNQQPVDLSDDLKFTVYDPLSSTLAEPFTPLTKSSGLTVSGPDNNILTIVGNRSLTPATGAYSYVLDNTTMDMEMIQNTFIIKPLPAD